MKPEMSTAVMIERVREMATDSSDSQDRVLLTQVANRIELLLAAESGLSREMACIRHALDIPPDHGVVDAFVRLNAKIQDLSGQLSKPESVYQYQSEIYNEDSGETELYWDDCDIGFYRQYAEDRRRILYSAPVQPAVVTAEHQRVIGLLLGVCGAAFELADDSCEQEVDGEPCHVVPENSFSRLSDRLDEIENTLPYECADLPCTVLQWAAVPRYALRSLLQSARKDGDA
ncbi:hypothetical protein PZA22_14305 [Pectobacterium polaris]|uniref:hypothetical protein n=1 Tax=Pectobacterium polaris TaxID=2042057 RepID=UPI0023B05D2A|nr:hypothetical protein [Pectobacterium polaris]MDE8755652.1 hypothetical protein [Pectobacterium polaris]